MKALTLWQPWAWAIVAGHKRIENRPWAPHYNVLGQVIAIHAGKVYDLEGEEFLREKGIVVPADAAHVHGAVVGVARIAGYLEKDALWSKADPAYGDPMFFGRFGWKLADIRAVGPFECKGSLGLWRLPVDVERLVVEVTQPAV